MKIKWTRLATAIGLSAMLAGPAAAGLIAGWDFSDQSGDGAAVASAAANLTGTGVTSATVTTTGDVLASSLPPGTNSGDDDGLQGGINGAYGGDLSEPTFAPGQVSFVGGAALGITARDDADASFQAVLSAPSAGTYVVSFGGRAIVDAAAPGSGETEVDVRFGASCGSAGSVGTVTLGEEDTEVTIFAGSTGSTTPCLVLDVDGTSVQPLLDNVAISTVPEPGFAGLLVAGGVALAGMARRRQR